MLTKLWGLRWWMMSLLMLGSTINYLTVVNSPREISDVRLPIGSNAASVWWVNGKEVNALSNDRQTVIDDGVSKRLTLQKVPMSSEPPS